MEVESHPSAQTSDAVDKTDNVDLALHGHKTFIEGGEVGMDGLGDDYPLEDIATEVSDIYMASTFLKRKLFAILT